MPGTYISPAETGFYYLQSRYYDPSICRFINADGYVSTGQRLLGNNMFAYCGNNPIRYIDVSGKVHRDATDPDEDDEEDDEDDYKIVGAGLQISGSADLLCVSGSVGVELVVYWDTAQCQKTGGPVIALYWFGEVDGFMDLDSLPSGTMELVELLMDSSDLLKTDGINAFQAIVAGAKFNFSFSGSFFIVEANNTFTDSLSYTEWFNNESVEIGSVKFARAWSDACRTYSIGYTHTIGKPWLRLAWPKISKGRSWYGMIAEFCLGGT